MLVCVICTRDPAAHLPYPVLFPVYRPEASPRVVVMRWGFHRPFNPSINNARSDKLEAGMWADAIRVRGCVIPMSLFYEWGAGGRKLAHEFHNPDDDYLWIAGIDVSY